VARRVLHDEYFLRAKREGYLARSAYKLLEINERFRLLRPGQRVLDAGCAPGSWLQVASQLVGPRGVVVGFDLSAVRHPMPANVRTVVADVRSLDSTALVTLAGGRFDAVISDMAPSTTGHGDDLVSARLCRSLLDALPGLLAPSGRLVMKTLEGAETPPLLGEARGRFTSARLFKPKASRGPSRETYLVAEGYRPPHTDSRVATP